MYFAYPIDFFTLPICKNYDFHAWFDFSLVQLLVLILLRAYFGAINNPITNLMQNK